jgi:hypothetical protein
VNGPVCDVKISVPAYTFFWRLFFVYYCCALIFPEMFMDLDVCTCVLFASYIISCPTILRVSSPPPLPVAELSIRIISVCVVKQSRDGEGEKVVFFGGLGLALVPLIRGLVPKCSSELLGTIL